MKIIRPNDIEIEANPKWPSTNQQNPRECVKKLTKINDEDIHYMKSERDENLIGCYMHPFVQAVHIAYSQHLPVTISPDMIWYLIASGIAQHINNNAEKLRKSFVDHDGKKVIHIRRDDFVLKCLANPWHELIDEFSMKIGEMTKAEVADTLQANFSTTTKYSRVVSQIVLMDAMKQYFDYRFSTRCGVPEIRVSGTREDWVNVEKKTQKMIEIIPDLNKWWKNGLKEILEQFINVFDDKVDKTFWNEIYKYNGGSGGPYINGWILALFPYEHTGTANRYVWEESWRESKGRSSGLTSKSFGYHLNQVPFIWEYYEKEIKMLFAGGLIGVLAEKDNNLLPVFGYAVMEDKIQNENKNNF